jgi:hypothetical protein
MNDELENIWKEAVVAESRYYPSICLGGLRKTTKILSQDIWFPARDSKREHPEYALPLSNRVPSINSRLNR